ncbi:multiple epidermal growth factor-like domains protein 6 [Caerostris extrusa]|uniref:Multiple epidermal growth factor-like domains protein 6 n=1 Tax=Caerostris extrusa TaxID=172846 RepID=A0AAV4USF7_CAEEX|nr:multiple epidermal growth factor-like domains protein 6 [Caerostris extrusa]
MKLEIPERLNPRAIRCKTKNKKQKQCMINPSDKIDLNTRRNFPANTRPVLPSVERHLNQFTKESNMIGIFIFAAILQAVAHVHSERRACSDLRVWDTENTSYQNLDYREKKFVYTHCKYQGFRVDGDHTIECVHGQPAKPLPQCKPMRQSCISLKDPPNGSKWCSPTAPEVGSWCVFRCTGTHYLQGSVRRDCGQDHRWTGQEAQCLPYSTTLNTGCRPLHAPFFGWKSCSPNDKDLGSICTFQCNDTHYLRGSTERLCTQNHEWSGAPARCMLKPECSLPILDDKIRTECSLHRKVKLNEVCSFSCVEGFQLKGPDQLKCQLNGLLTDNKGKQNYPSCHIVTDPCTTSNCQQFCRSVSGRAQCYCAEGFALTENGRTCSDIDECKTNTHHCQQECRNSIGSYTCACRQGFKLIDRYQCEENKPHRGKEGTEKIPGSKRSDTCQFHNGGCFHTCKVEFGNVQCGCTTGFELENDGKRCRKIVEAVDSRPTVQLSCADHNGLCSHACSDEEFGGLRCSCPEGFRLLWNNRTCEGKPLPKQI